MKLSRVEIKNFRGIVHQSLDVYAFTTLIGPNNAGKSTVLRAIEILLDQQKPALDEWNSSAANANIEIIGQFVNISEAERNIPGIAGLIFDGEILLKVTATKEEKGPELNYTAFVQEERIRGFSDTWRDLSEEIRTAATDLGITAVQWRTRANKERVRERIRQTHADLIELGEPGWTDEGISIKEALKQGLPRVEVVPAVRDASEEGRLTQRKNIFLEILEGTVLPEISATAEYGEIIKSAEGLSARMVAEEDPALQKTRAMSDSLTKVAGHIIDLRILFRLAQLDIKKAISTGAQIRLSDGVETPVERQGHGAQRTLIYALVRHIAIERAKAAEHTRSILLLFEEPEIYIHPQLLRALRESLRELSKTSDWQVVVTTHSPVMIDVVDIPQSLAILRKEGSPSQVVIRQLKHDPFLDQDGEVDERQMLRAALDFHPSVCEAFFSNHAILVEGDSEVAIFRFAKEIIRQSRGTSIATERHTVVSCGGKWTIVPIARLLTEYGIPVKVIHDLDRKKLTDEELEKKPGFHPFKANTRIAEIVGEKNTFVIGDTLEDIVFDDPEERSATDKPYRAWVQIKELLAAGEINKSPEVVRMIEFAYDLLDKEDEGEVDAAVFVISESAQQ
jgi:putative ATP-dependent endonuclease of the OLD family